MTKYGWLVVLGFNATLTAKVISWRFPGFFTLVLTQLFFPKPLTTFLTCFCRGERRKYARKKSCLNRGSNSQPPGHESDTLTTEPPGRGDKVWYMWQKLFDFSVKCRKTLREREKILVISILFLFYIMFSRTLSPRFFLKHGIIRDYLCGKGLRK